MFLNRNALVAFTFTILGVDTAAAMTCDQLKAELVTLQGRRASDENALARCSANSGSCSIQLVRFFQQNELTIDEKIQLDKSLQQINCSSPRTPDPAEVTTYHYDMLRTGWNSHEKNLTPKTFSDFNFGRSHVTLVDEKVSAQPLVVPNQLIVRTGVRDVVYVATEANTVFAIDAQTGAILLTSNLGPAVPSQAGCDDNGKLQGITSTPLIDINKKALYVVSFQWVTSDPLSATTVHKLYSLDLESLKLNTAPVDIQTEPILLDDGTTDFSFTSQYARQRSGLAAANGNIYAAFASHGDCSQEKTRGWLLGWNATTLAALPAHLVDRVKRGTFGLSSIWMSGYGVASDREGNLYAVTGNSGPGQDIMGGCPPSTSLTFNNPDNLSESAIKVSGDLTTLSSFTPENHDYLDCHDEDFGSGGIMLLPDQPGSTPHLAVAAGKDGKMFLLNRDNMNLLGTYNIGQCWCGPSYFEGSDGVNRIVSSGGSELKIWKLTTSLTPESSTPVINDDDLGFLTSVSSNSNDLTTTIIWAVTMTKNQFITETNRPITALTLFAFDAKGKLIYEGEIGNWDVNGHPNSVPVVSNGRVYIGGNREFAIFEPGYGIEPRVELTRPMVGVVEAIDGTILSVRRKDGKSFVVEAAQAINSQKSVPLSIGKSIAVRGELNNQGVLRAESISHGESISE